MILLNELDATEEKLDIKICVIDHRIDGLKDRVIILEDKFGKEMAMGYVTELDYARIRHKPTGLIGLVVPECFGFRWASWRGVQVLIENGNGQGASFKIFLIEELEVLERLDPASVDHSLFSLNGSD